MFIKRDTQDQRKLCSRAELTCLNGTDRVPGYTYHFCKSSLRQAFLITDLFESVFQYQFIVHMAPRYPAS